MPIRFLSHTTCFTLEPMAPSNKGLSIYRYTALCCFNSTYKNRTSKTAVNCFPSLNVDDITEFWIILTFTYIHTYIQTDPETIYVASIPLHIPLSLQYLFLSSINRKVPNDLLNRFLKDVRIHIVKWKMLIINWLYLAFPRKFNPAICQGQTSSRSGAKLLHRK